MVAAISDGKIDYVRANVPPFVYAAADSDPELLVRLVRQTDAVDHEAGRRLAEMVAEYLDKQFIRSRFAEGVATAIAKRVRDSVVH